MKTIAAYSIQLKNVSLTAENGQKHYWGLITVQDATYMAL